MPNKPLKKKDSKPPGFNDNQPGFLAPSLVTLVARRFASIHKKGSINRKKEQLMGALHSVGAALGGMPACKVFQSAPAALQTPFAAHAATSLSLENLGRKLSNSNEALESMLIN